MIGGVVATELLAQVFEVAAHGEIDGAFVANALAVPLRAVLGRGRARGRVRRALVGPHRARRGVPVLPAVQQAPAHRHELPEHLVPQARAARRAAQDGPRGRRSPSSACGRSRTSAGRTCSTASRAPSAAAARRPARPTTRASRSTPRPSSWASGTCRSRRSTGSTSSRTRRSCATPTASRTPSRTPRRSRPRSSTRPSPTTRSGTA